MTYPFIIMFLITILSLSVYYQFSSDINEHFAEEITADEEYIKSLNLNGSTDSVGVSSSFLQNDGQNKLTKRETQMNKLRDSLNSSHEMEEKTFELLKKDQSKSTIFDNDIFDRTTYYEFKEGDYSGINKCHNECDGNCLEFGPTGHSWCFPAE